MSSIQIRSAAEAVFAELLEDCIMTTVIGAHREIKRGRATCSICGTKCRIHIAPINNRPLLPLSRESSPVKLYPNSTSNGGSTSTTNGGGGTSSTAGSAGPSSRPGGYAVGPEKGTGKATGIGSGSGRVDTNGNAFFDCLVCYRAVTSSRYAPHLSSCLNMNGSTRRGASRMASAKARLGNGDRSSPSPYVHSDNGDSDVDSVTGVKRGRKPNGSVKRALSPGKPMLKKTKLSSASGTATSNQHPSHIPSRLGGPPTNARPSSDHSSSSSSPAKSLASFGNAARKTLPGMSSNGVGGSGADRTKSRSLGGSVAGTLDGDGDGDDEDENDLDNYIDAESVADGTYREDGGGDESSEVGDDDY